MTDPKKPDPPVLTGEIVESSGDLQKKDSPPDRLSRLVNSVAFLGGVIYRIYQAVARSNSDSPAGTRSPKSDGSRQRRRQRRGKKE